MGWMNGWGGGKIEWLCLRLTPTPVTLNIAIYCAAELYVTVVLEVPGVLER